MFPVIRAMAGMVASKEVNVVSRYESLSKNNVMGDFRFIVMEKCIVLKKVEFLVVVLLPIYKFGVTFMY